MKDDFADKFMKKKDPDPFFSIDEEVSKKEANKVLDIRDFEMKDEKKPNYVVYKIVNIEKTESGTYFYLTETSQGRLWLERKEIFPKYSDLLCLYYESYLTFK